MINVQCVRTNKTQGPQPILSAEFVQIDDAPCSISRFKLTTSDEAIAEKWEDSRIYSLSELFAETPAADTPTEPPAG